MLLSGLHTVCDLFCIGCLNLIGWKYVIFYRVINILIIFFVKEHTDEISQKYKEGKFILEKEKIKKHYWTI